MRTLLRRWPLLQTLPTVGVTVSDFLVAVSLRGDPPRLTGVYRCPLTPSSNRRRSLERAAVDARRSLRIPAGSPVVLALWPVEPVVRLPLSDGWSRRPIPVHGDPIAAAALERAGFDLARFDLLPAALARFARCSIPHGGQIVASGWSVVAVGDVIDAAAVAPDDVGGGGESWFPISPDLPGIRVPATVGRHLDVGTDAGAIGAALRGLGFSPGVMVDGADRPRIEAHGDHRVDPATTVQGGGLE